MRGYSEKNCGIIAQMREKTNKTVRELHFTTGVA